MSTAVCWVDGCERPSRNDGLCRLHWERRRRGAPLDQSPDAPPHGVWGELTVLDDGHVLCHECGQGWRNLGRHVQKHGMTPREYKLEYGLPLTQGMASADYKDILRDRLASIPQMTDHLPPVGGAIGSQDRDALRHGARRRDHSAAARATRARLAKPEVRTCPDCGAEWCPMPGSDRKRSGTKGCGSDTCASRSRMKRALTTRDERAARNQRIVERITAGESRRAVAERYGITPEAVGQIVRRAER